MFHIAKCVDMPMVLWLADDSTIGSGGSAKRRLFRRLVKPYSPAYCGFDRLCITSLPKAFEFEIMSVSRADAHAL